MRRFGSDKPDLRFGVELVECTEYFSDTPFRVFQAPYVGAVVMPGGASQPRRTLDGWQEFAKQRGHRGLAYVLVGEDGTLGGPVAKNLTDAERDGLAAHVGAKPGDCVFFSAGPAKTARALLGATRIEIAKRLDMIDPAAWAFTWVVDLPLFEAADEVTASGDVAVGSGRMDGRAPRVHLAQAGVRGHVRHRPWQCAGQRLRHRAATATRSAAGRSVSTAATSRSGCSR